MAREFERMSLPQHGDPQLQRRPMMPAMPGMGTKFMPREFAAMMEQQQMMPPIPHELVDGAAWEKAFRDSLHEEDPEFAAFEQVYGRPQEPRSHRPPRPAPGPVREAGPRQRAWAEEFEEDNKFAEFEAIYRTYPCVSHQTFLLCHFTHFSPMHVYRKICCLLTRVTF